MKILEPQLIKVRIDELKFDSTNPNQLTQKQMHGLYKSMEKYGYLVPCIIDQNGLIADGEHRALVYKQMGIKEIPCYKLKFESDAERRMLRQIMNKLHGEHDMRMDADELASIFQNNQLAELSEMIAHQQHDLEQLVQRYRPDVAFNHKEEFEQITEADMKRMVPDSKLGQLYQLGRHRVICADTTDIQSINKLLDGKKVDMVFTDPPYNIMGSSQGFTQMDDDNMVRPFFRAMAQMIVQSVKEDGHVYICCNWRSFVGLSLECKASGLVPKNVIIWHKPNARLGSMYSNSHEFIFFLSNEKRDKRLTEKRDHVRTVYSETNVWVYQTDTNTIREHYAEKPIVLPERAIKNSTDKDESVMDLFLGTGTTLIAAEKMGRTCYGVEIDARYVDITIKRWEKYTGQKAVKLN